MTRVESAGPISTQTQTQAPTGGAVQTLIVPGLFGSGEGHWQRVWHEDLPQTRMLQQADWEHPDLETWLAALDAAVEAGGETYIIAHSLGCLLTAHLSRCRSARNVKGAFLVAPCDLRRTEALHPGRLAFDAVPVMPLPFPSLIIGSLNDPYMTPGELDRLKDDLEAPLHTIGAAGHINIASGYGRWAQGYTLFDAFRRDVEGRSASARSAHGAAADAQPAFAGRSAAYR
ncbi:hypothetical protein DFI02_11178 [Rhizobium sp. PP-F2F-G20b]|nr:hypothetical protein DFI02_11178 [Rhizobium sp. PP-F2F-G20b]